MKTLFALMAVIGLAVPAYAGPPPVDGVWVLDARSYEIAAKKSPDVAALWAKLKPMNIRLSFGAGGKYHEESNGKPEDGTWTATLTGANTYAISIKLPSKPEPRTAEMKFLVANSATYTMNLGPGKTMKLSLIRSR